MNGTREDYRVTKSKQHTAALCFFFEVHQYVHWRHWSHASQRSHIRRWHSAQAELTRISPPPPASTMMDELSESCSQWFIHSATDPAAASHCCRRRRCRLVPLSRFYTTGRCLGCRYYRYDDVGCVTITRNVIGPKVTIRCKCFRE